MERDQEGGRGGGRDRRKKKWSAVLQTLPVLAGAVKKPTALAGEWHTFSPPTLA